MPPLIARVNELVQWRTQRGTLYARSISIATEGRTRDLFGDVFGVLQAEAPAKAGDALAGLIETALAQLMADSVEECVRLGVPEPDFETVVSRLNLAMARQFDAEQLPFAPDAVSGALVSQRGCEIVAAAWGEPFLILIHPTPSGTTMADLLADVRSEREKAMYDPTTRRGFSHIVNGSIGRNDRLLVATADLRELMGKEKLASIMTANDPESAGMILNDILAPLAPTLSIAALVADAVPLEKLRAAEAERAVAPPAQPQQPQPPAKPFGARAIGIYRRVRAAVLAGASVCKTMASSEGRRAAVGNLQLRLQNRLTIWLQKFNALSTATKFGGIAGLAALLALNLGLALNGLGQARQAKIDAYHAKVGGIEQHVTAAEASMVYDDYGTARLELEAAGNGVAALPDKTEDQRKTKELLTQKIGAAKLAWQRVVPLPEPDVIASIAAGSALPALERLALVNDGIWSLSSAGEVFLTSVKDGSSRSFGKALSASPVFLTPADNGFVAGGADGAITAISASGAVSARSIQTDGDAAVIADAAAYGSRLYVLDPKHNRILRHAATAAGFGKPAFYLKDGTDLTAAVSMTIDGSIYVLAKNGAIIKLTKGLRDDFANESAEPAVLNATALAMTDGRLYILEPDQERVVAVNKKTGRIESQFVSAALKEARDFAVGPDDSYLLAAAGNRVLRFDLIRK